MNVVILAGGRGTRLEDDTKGVIPKPMVAVGDIPLIEHIVRLYHSQGHSQFIVASGHLGYVLADWAKTGLWVRHANVTVVQTGEDTCTGGRLRRLDAVLAGLPFLLTYGDGLADVNLAALADFHFQMAAANGVLVTLTAVRPPNRFGYVEVASDGTVAHFAEKPLDEGSWVNGGFYVCQSEVMRFISGDGCVLEKDVLPALAQRGMLAAYKHEGFWQCIDHPRERQMLTEVYQSGQAPWLRWESKHG